MVTEFIVIVVALVGINAMRLMIKILVTMIRTKIKILKVMN